MDDQQIYVYVTEITFYIVCLSHVQVSY